MDEHQEAAIAVRAELARRRERFLQERDDVVSRTRRLVMEECHKRRGGAASAVGVDFGHLPNETQLPDNFHHQDKAFSFATTPAQQ